MKKKFNLTGVMAAAAVICSLPQISQAAFDQNITPDILFGSGVANGGWTVTQAGGVELGLRAKVRFPTPLNQFNSNGDGTYTFAAGNFSGSPFWSFEWSVNTDYQGTSGLKLNNLTYRLRIDSDASAATSFIEFDPIRGGNPAKLNQVLWDHGIGNNSTANGVGDDDKATRTVATYAALLAANNVAQNSWRMDFFSPLLFPFNPNSAGSYTFQLEAFDSLNNSVALTEITVNAVPEPSTYVAGALLLLPFAASTIRSLRKKQAA